MGQLEFTLTQTTYIHIQCLLSSQEQIILTASTVLFETVICFMEGTDCFLVNRGAQDQKLLHHFRRIEQTALVQRTC